MTISQLEYFLELSEELNFTRVAERHYISQTAVTQQIKALEANLGFSLFKRTKRQVVLTPAGIVYKREIAGILLRLKEAKKKAALAEHGFSGTLSIGFLQGIETTGITDILQEFTELYPEISITFQQGNNKELLTSLKQQTLDICFSFTPFLNENTSLIYDVYKEIPLYVVLPKNHSLSFKSSLTRAELIHETLLVLSSAMENILYGYVLSGFNPEKIIYADDINSLLMMIGANMGIAILPAYNTYSLYNADRIQRIPLINDQEIFRISMIHHKDTANACVDAFVKIFHNHLSAKSQ